MEITRAVIWTVVGVYALYKIICKFINYMGLGNYYTLGNDKNPFLKDARLPIKPKVFDQKLRDAVIKQNFKEEKVPKDLDVIIIGSGIGGLASAALLAKTGKKVLVLEQHDQAGGCCHTFIEKGYEFDVGIHYIGEMNSQTLNKTFLDQISDGQIEWADMDDNFDTVVYKDGKNIEKFTICSNVEKQKSYLKTKFPLEGAAIDKYYKDVNEMRGVYMSAMPMKFIPHTLIKILNYFGIINIITNFFTLNKKCLKDTLEDITSNQTLRDIFCYCYGNYGTVPSIGSYPVQLTLSYHYMTGASYPVGGPSEIAYHIIPVIERAGGKVLVNCKVKNILINSDGRAYGISMIHGTKQYEFMAPIIISNAGLHNTMGKLLPTNVAQNSNLYPIYQKSKPGLTALSIFVGFDCPVEELDVAINKNYWVFNQKNIDQAAIDYLNKSRDECEDIIDLPLNFLSFPSTKDPTWEKKYPGKTTMVIISPVNYKWFEDWETAPALRRGDEYESIKKSIAQRSIDSACDLFPKLRDHIDYVSVGTPLSNNFYLRSTEGELYGLDHSQNRFALEEYSVLRPGTDIPGLYLSGQDVCCCGFTGALYGGLVCAQKILGRYIIADLETLQKQITSSDKNN